MNIPTRQEAYRKAVNNIEKKYSREREKIEIELEKLLYDPTELKLYTEYELINYPSIIEKLVNKGYCIYARMQGDSYIYLDRKEFLKTIPYLTRLFNKNIFVYGDPLYIRMHEK
jgi:hypothetical protein